jgi:hypothetical protein
MTFRALRAGLIKERQAATRSLFIRTVMIAPSGDQSRPAELVCQNTAHHSRAIALGSLRRTDGGPSALGPHHRDDDVIAPNRKMTASVIANLKQVVKEGSLRLHPLVTRLVDPETLQKTREPGSDRIRDVRF